MIQKKKIAKESSTDKQQLLKSCLYCKYAKRPRVDLPYLCRNEYALGFSDPWDMPIFNCKYFIKRKE
jgi:hypothetical protein